MFFWQSGQPHRRMNSLKPKRPCTVKSICMEWVQSRAVANWTVHVLCETCETHQATVKNSVFLASESGSCYILLSHMANLYIYIHNNIFIYHTYHIYIIIYILKIYIYDVYDIYIYINIVIYIYISHDLSLVWCHWQNIHHDPPAIHFRSQNVIWGQRLGNVNKHQIQSIYIIRFNNIEYYSSF